MPATRDYAWDVRAPSVRSRDSGSRLAPRRLAASWAGRLPATGLGALAAVLLGACGSATATHPAGTPATKGTSASVAAGGARDSAAASAVSDSAAVGGDCAATVTSTLGEVGKRIYDEAASGGNVAQAVHRVQSSTALAAAINAGNAGAARASLQALLLNQIVRVEVLRGGRPFAAAGSGAALAPVRGRVPGTGASFVLSVQADRAYMQLAQRVTGAELLLLAGAHRVAGTIAGPPPATVPVSGPLSFAGQSYEVFSLTGAAYPSGALRVVLLVPAAALSCPGATARARIETLGRVGERIYAAELGSPEVLATLRQLEGSRAFQRAVAGGDPAATRAAIVGFFRAHIHVVRVRVTIGSRLLVDVGGPFVLAPVRGTLRSNGRVLGHFTMAIQDDAGYLKLARLFTGAEVLMRAEGRQVMGTLLPGPPSVPERGEVTYRGRRYQAHSFTGQAFPSGPLRISLLLGT